MTEQDLAEIESRLAVRLPQAYKRFALSHNLERLFSSAQQVVFVNELNRQMSWLGRPLDHVFFIFGVDKDGRELLLDLDIPEPPVMVADYERQRGKVLAWSFNEWLARYGEA